MDSAKKVCLIVPTFSKNSSEIISELISIVNIQSIAAIDLIVVNNNSYVLNIAQTFSKGNLYIINGKKNLGSAGGFYLGMKYARNIGYDSYILGDDDAKFLDTSTIESLIESAFMHNNTIPYLYWQEKFDLFGKKVPASVSCYGCITYDNLQKLGLYSPFFFYGGEDGAYGLMAKWKGVKFQLIDFSFSHPLKPWLTYSRGSSGLSVFRHNSILQHYWTIAHSPSLLEILRSSTLIYIYILSVLYGIIFFDSYFRYQSLYNLRNIVFYIPPIIFTKSKLTWMYPLYRDPFEDEVFETFKQGSVDEVSAEERYYHYSHNSIVVIDSWFPYLAFQSITSVKNFLSHRKIYLLHGKDKNKDEIYAKLLLDFGHPIHKFLSFFLMILLFPFAAAFTLMIWVAVSLKYLIVGLYMKIFEEKLFHHFR